MTHPEIRAAITRALTAQAWAVACAVCNDNGEPIDVEEMPHYAHVMALDIADIPAPADLAAIYFKDGQ